MGDQEFENGVKLAIGSMCKAADDLTRLVIDAYDHNATHATNQRNMSGSSFKTDQLEKCAIFLGLKTRESDNSLIYTNKLTMADRIITKLESYFPSHCKDCGESYQIPFGTDHSHHLHCFQWRI